MGTVNSCCCGCSLAQGTTGAGIFSVIHSIILFVLGTLILTSDLQFKNQENIDSNSDNFPQSETTELFIETMGWATVGQGVVILIVAILLLVGVSKRKRSLVLPWLIVTGLAIALSVVGLFKAFNIIQLVFSVLFIVILIYLFIVVNSFYRFLQIQPCGVIVENGISGFNQPGYVIQAPNVTGYEPLTTETKGYQHNPTQLPAAYPTTYSTPYASQVYPPQVYGDGATANFSQFNQVNPPSYDETVKLPPPN